MGETVIRIDQDKIDEFSKMIPTVMQQAQQLVIVDDEDYEFSLAMREECKRRMDVIAEFFATPKKLAFDTHRSITGMENRMLEPYQQADEIIAQKRTDYRLKKDQEEAERRKRQEAEAKAERDRAIKEEQDRLAKEAAERESARKKQLDDLQAEAERLRTSGESGAAVVIEKQTAEIEATHRLERQTEHEQTAELIEKVASAPLIMPAPRPAVPKQKGAVLSKPWKFRIVDVDKIDRKYMVPDESKIRKVVEALGDKADIDGIEVYQDDREAIRRQK